MAQSETSEDKTCKLILIGDVGVGKTSLIQRFISTDNYTRAGQTVDIPECSKTVVKFPKQRAVDLEIYDTLGQEKFASFTNSYYRQSNAIMFVFDITNRQSFQNTGTWLRRAFKNGCLFYDDMYDIYFGSYCILVGNKSDLSLFERKVSRWEANLLASKFDMRYYETSAIEQTNVREAFHEIVAGFLLFENLANSDDETDYYSARMRQRIESQSESSGNSMRNNRRRSRTSSSNSHCFIL